jgi:prepilin-type N-terminal cleavage/methylation domain-containing protein
LNNKGFSLIEIIIVVAIIAISLTLVFVSVNTIFALDVQKAGKEIVSALNKEKVACMTHQGYIYLRLYQNSTGIYIDECEDGNQDRVLDKEKNEIITTEITKKACLVTYNSSDITGKTIANPGTKLDNTGIYIAFNRNDGSLMTLGQAAELYNPKYIPPYAFEYLKSIVITSGNTERTITLSPQTGKVTLAG